MATIKPNEFISSTQEEQKSTLNQIPDLSKSNEAIKLAKTEFENQKSKLIADIESDRTTEKEKEIKKEILKEFEEMDDLLSKLGAQILSSVDPDQQLAKADLMTMPIKIVGGKGVTSDGPLEPNEVNTPRLARGVTKGTLVDQYEPTFMIDSGGEIINEPVLENKRKYPYNKVEESESGHLREVDDTRGHERIKESHRMGTFYEVHPDGTKVTKVVGKNFMVIVGDDYTKIEGGCSVHINGDANLLCIKDVNIKSLGNFNALSLGETNITSAVSDVSVTSMVGDVTLTAQAGNVDLVSVLGIAKIYGAAMTKVLSTGVTKVSATSLLELEAKGNVLMHGAGVQIVSTAAPLVLSDQTSTIAGVVTFKGLI